MKYNLIKSSEVENISADEIVSMHEKYYNPGILFYLKILGFHSVQIDYAEGMNIFLKNGKKILDLTGGVGTLNIGHNHPRILEIRKKICEEKRIEICKAFISPYLSVLSKNMASVSPGDLNYSFFCNSGSEAIENAFKTAEKYQGLEKKIILYSDKSFHGKTRIAMSVSHLEESRKYFNLMENCVCFEYNNIESLKNKIELYGNKISSVILEAVHGTRVIIPDSGYLRQVRDICNENDILLIIDEVFTGFGRTGKMFAFEHENIIPDIFCFSKSIGGGKASIAGIMIREHIFKKAFGSPNSSNILSTTFSGMTEECITAIETLNIINDEELVEKSRESGLYFHNKLIELKKKMPDKINEIRSIGLLHAIEFNSESSGLNKIINNILKISVKHSISEIFSAFIFSELFHNYNILTYMSYSRRDILIFSPPLIITKKEIDYVVDSLEKVLSKEITGLSTQILKRFALG